MLSLRHAVPVLCVAVAASTVLLISMASRVQPHAVSSSLSYPTAVTPSSSQAFPSTLTSRDVPLTVGVGATQTRFDLDLGVIYAGQVVEKTVLLENHSESPMVLDGASDCGCVTLHIASRRLEAGESTRLVIRYQSAYQTAPDNVDTKRYVIVRTGGIAGNKVVVGGAIRVQVKPGLVVSPQPVVWRLSSVNPQAYAALRNVQLSNLTAFPLSIHPRLAPDAPYSLKPVSSDPASIPGSDNPGSFLLPAGQTMSLPLLLSEKYLGQRRPFDSEFSLTATFTDHPEQTPMTFAVRALANDEPDAYAIPGSLILRKSDLDSEAKRRQVIRIQAADGVRVDQVKATVRGNMAQVLESTPHAIVVLVGSDFSTPQFETLDVQVNCSTGTTSFSLPVYLCP